MSARLSPDCDMDPDNLVPWTSIPASVVGCEKHRQLALQMARESMVLLQNKNNVLPLKKQGLKVAVLGPNANDSTMQWGNYNGNPIHTVTILDGIKSKCADVTYIPGCGHTANTGTESRFSNIISPDGKVGLRATYYNNEEMVGDAAAVQYHSTPLQLSNGGAIVQAWYSGEQGGAALADVLFGDYNPSGKLPVTFYKNTNQLPGFEDYDMAGRTYRFMEEAPLFPFGHGLSFSDFTLSKIKYSKGNVTLNITNHGTMDGDETVQVYLRRVGDTAGPKKTLRAYQRIHVKVGATVNAAIPLPRTSFEWWDDTNNVMRILPGKYELMVGTDSNARPFTVVTIK